MSDMTVADEQAVPTELLVANGILIAVMIACVVSWIRLFRRHVPGTPLVPVQPRSWPFWTPLAFVSLVGLIFVLSPLAFSLSTFLIDGRGVESGVDPAAPSSTARVAAGSSTFLLSCAIVAVAFAIQRPNALRDFGFEWSTSDLFLGLKAALLTIPPLMLLMGLLNQLVDYEHEVLNAIDDGATLGSFAFLFTTTAIITPFVEEFSLRTLLQGGLQAFADQKLDTQVPDYRGPDSEDAPLELPVSAVEAKQADPPLAMARPYAVKPAADTDPNSPSELPPQHVPVAYWPLFVTSAVFAALHFGQGLAPIALFFFSLTLGYLYRQTGRLTASLVLHATLNSLTMIAAYFGV